ncbi:hypothetical protein CVIRNUC_005815 [Coccomyxa viridis]|uniref:Uncharacterized protein n=1 Tax=Coccomyxa viridis TaxID=1274662 RepID=A0AAV1I7W4_9CHLO|nr:hypothetical protein CVIRNUC_005815 [Coccomyxa viridis]
MEAILVGLPVVLPLLALYASRKREKAVLEAALLEVRAAWQGAAQQLQQRDAVQVAQVAQAVQQLRADLQQQLPSGKLKAIESKLAALEGSVLSAGRSAQSAARSLDAAGAQMADAAAARMDKIGQELLRDVQEGLQSNASVPLKQLSTLNAKLEGIESNLAILEDAQAENVRQMAQEVVAAVEDSEAQVQRALQTEARRSAESLQRLPALLAAALPVMDVTALQALPEGGSALSRQRQACQLAPADKAWLQSMLESAMQQAADKVLDAQGRRDVKAIPALLAEEQWEALGRRLQGIESSLQGAPNLEAASSEAREAQMQSLMQLETIQSDMSAALAAAREAQGGGLVLQDSLAKVTTLIETLAAQRDRGANAIDGTAMDAMLKDLQKVSSELSKSRAAMEAALQESTPPGTAAAHSSLSMSAVQEAARAAAAEILKQLQHDGKLGGAAHSISGPGQGTTGSNGAGQAAAANGAPKGYKGNPNDTRADAFKKMQELLTSQDSSSSPAPHQQGPASPGQPAEGTAQPDTDDLVPISAWLGQDSGQEAMDRRIAEEALLAGVDAISEQALHEASVATSGAAGFAPGAAEGLASAPVQRQLDRTLASDSLSSDIQPSSGLSGRDDERTGTTAQGCAEISASSSSQETGFAADGSGNGVSTGRHAPSEETASNEQTSRGESSSAYVSRDPAGQQEAYREGSGAEAAQEQLAGLLEEGKALLRQGRELSRGGYDYGEADALLQDAMACFEEAAAIEPTSVKVLGNWGNALMAYGNLKKRYLSALQEGPEPYSYEERDAASLAEEQITGEAEAALVVAGQKFLAVVEQNPEDARALGNWGNALCLRAELAQDAVVACALYEAAVAKYEAVLEMDTRNQAILRNCAFALYDLGRLQPDPSSKTARQLLEDAARYFQDVLMLSGEDENVAAALDNCMADLEDVRAMST